MSARAVPRDAVGVTRPVALEHGLGELPVRWWFPIREPVVGVAWVQHGFARDPHYLQPLGAALCERGLVVGLPAMATFRRRRSINDDRYLDAIGSALTRLPDPGGALPSAAAHAGTSLSAEAASRLVLVGHSAGCAVVIRASLRARSEGFEPRGFVLLDPTDNLARSFARSVDAVSGDVRVVAAAPSRCNRHGHATALLQRARPGYLGIRITTGSHCDAGGYDHDRLCSALCGRPDAENVRVLYESTLAWTHDLAAGLPTPQWSPGGSRLEAEVRAGRVSPLA